MTFKSVLSSKLSKSFRIMILIVVVIAFIPVIWLAWFTYSTTVGYSKKCNGVEYKILASGKSQSEYIYKTNGEFIAEINNNDKIIRFGKETKTPDGTETEYVFFTTNDLPELDGIKNLKNCYQGKDYSFKFDQVSYTDGVQKVVICTFENYDPSVTQLPKYNCSNK